MSASIQKELNQAGFPFSWSFKNPGEVTALYLPLGLLLSFLSLMTHPRPVWETMVFIFSGIFLWTLIEYILHRFVFHLSTLQEPWQKLISEAHLEHHRTASTGEKILVRPFFSLVTALVVYFLLALITFSFGLAALLETGVFMGYLAYEGVHFAAHRFQLDSSIGKFLKHYHLHHHFKNASRCFGVTSPLWDWVFRTLPNNERDLKPSSHF